MMTAESLKELYQHYIYDLADDRINKWFMVESPWPPLFITITYALFCWNAKKISKSWPTYSLKPLLVVYNFALVILSAYMTYEFFMSAYLSNYSLLCQPVDYSTFPLAIRMANVCWWFFISKYIELLDTVFFVMRKKYNQVTFLHTYHHCTMLINWWLGIKYVAGGQSFLMGMINSFIHVLMYTYYALSCIGPHMQKYLWWKKYLTSLQLIQFVIILVHTTYNLYDDCPFPDWLNLIVMFYMVSLIVLFSNFYIQSYLKKKTKSG